MAQPKNVAAAHPQLGLKENWKQFTLLVVINGFVGAMVGIERSVFPRFAEAEFGVESAAAVLSFIAAFGLAKAAANYYTGRLADRFGRRKLLVIGWALALPVPLLLIWAPTWSWVVAANILLGASQGFAWSSTVVMKIDLVGEKNRGLAMGFNEFAGYFAVGITAFLSGWTADRFGVTPYPFYIGIAVAVIGFLLSLIWARDTRTFVKKEGAESSRAPMKNVFTETSFTDKTLSSVTQAGLVNNLNDGMIWGLLPMLLLSLNYGDDKIGIVTAIYPAVWGIGQLFTGKMADIYAKKSMLFLGMLLQGAVILVIPITENFTVLIAVSALLGAGTALVYPTFLAAVADAAPPAQRAESIGTFRLWRDLGYVFGAVLSGIVADLFGLEAAVVLIGVVTVGSSLVIKFRMPDRKRSTPRKPA